MILLHIFLYQNIYTIIIQKINHSLSKNIDNISNLHSRAHLNEFALIYFHKSKKLRQCLIIEKIKYYLEYDVRIIGFNT